MKPTVAVVTGGGSGMGQIYARRMANDGVKVAIIDVNDEGLNKTAAESKNIKPYRCDISDLAAVEGTIRQIGKDLGTIDRFVHCAAIMPTAHLMAQPTALIHKLMSINYGGTVNVVKTALPEMLSRKGGEFIIFGSIAGSVLTPQLGAYGATKAATNAFTEVLIEENRGSGVHIMLVCPPMVNTPLLKQATENSNPKAIRDSIAKGRLADPNFMIDEVEKGIRNKVEILLPGAEAKILMRMRRYTPRLLWKIILMSMKE